MSYGNNNANKSYVFYFCVIVWKFAFSIRRTVELNIWEQMQMLKVKHAISMPKMSVFKQIAYFLQLLMVRQNVTLSQTHNIAWVSVAMSIWSGSSKNKYKCFSWTTADPLLMSKMPHGLWCWQSPLTPLSIVREWELEKMTDNATHLPKDLEGQGLARIPQRLSRSINVGGGLESAI